MSGQPFAIEELQAALHQCEFGKAPGCDNVPYEAFSVDIHWWQSAILGFLDLCRASSRVPSMWKHGIVVPLAKGSGSTDRNDYHPITLTCCFAKLLERLILNQVRPRIDPRLDDCQAGFRYGSDVQVYALLEALRLRQHVPTYCAFLDLRKAFDVAWRDAAMLRLRRAGISHELWRLIDDLVSDRSAAVRLDSRILDTWEVEHGIGQGAVLSGFLFNILINGLAAAIKRACNGVSCGSSCQNAVVKLLLYADDIVIFSDNPADLQRALDAAHAWVTSWRFHLGVGPQKSAVMIFGRGRGRAPAPVFFLGGQRVKTYTFLGVALHDKLSWKVHIEQLLARGERKMAACLFWTGSAGLPLSFVERIFQTYVHPSVCFGLEFVPAGPQTARFQTRVLQSGRRLLGWPRGSPSLAVQGQLGCVMLKPFVLSEQLVCGLGY